MNIVIDTSCVLAVATNEKHKTRLISLTANADLIAPASIHWEVGNALSAMFKRGRITQEQASAALYAYEQIPIQLSEVNLGQAVELSHDLDIYAYDAYMIVCAKTYRCPLLTLDRGLREAAELAGVVATEV